MERYNAGAPIDLEKLDGTWRLQYTSAPDVLVLLESATRLSFFQVTFYSFSFACFFLFVLIISVMELDLFSKWSLG